MARLTDAALTPYHSIKRSSNKITPSAFVFVIGIVGLGHMAVQILKNVYSATIIADDKLELAKKYGADYVVRTNKDIDTVAKEITRITDSKNVPLFSTSSVTIQHWP